jgi:AraC-like DNA-binding protein
VINTQFNQNFFDFVNTYRVEQAKRDLMDSKKRELKILAVAYDAGFNSKTSFNTLFKKHTGLSPSEYREREIES